VTFSFSRRVAAEFIGAMLLAAVVIGSGVMGEHLAQGNVALALLGNTLATAAILYVLITALAPISGAHFNPAVSLVMAVRGELSAVETGSYVAAQIAGCAVGVILAHALFGLPLLQASTHVRSSSGEALSEGAATFALLACILLVRRARPEAVAGAVALTIAAGYWWTASTSFANPAITIARSLSDTFAGIRPQDVPVFVLLQVMGAALASAVCGWLLKPKTGG
jgi:glycerol uptake facilitator-like aquaporin